MGLLLVKSFRIVPKTVEQSNNYCMIIKNNNKINKK